jgi:colanic acid biosynthesis glycosyl transferase WcaI
MFQFLSYQVGAVLAGWNQEYDVYLTVTAALQVWLPFFLLSVLRRKPAVYSVHDVYPDAGISLGLFRHKPVIRFVAGLEDYCFKHAKRVRVLSESFVPGLLDRGVLESKIRLIYDWIDTDMFKPLPRDNAFAVDHGLVDRFVVLYAGNIGPLQGLDHVLMAADLLREYRDIRFIFVGDGAARAALEEKATRLNLPNVEFLGYQPFERMPEILATADLSLVSLVKGSGFGALPSKVYGIFASGRPVLAIIDEGCEAWDLVQRADAGWCIPPEDPPRMAEAILTLKQDESLRERLGHNGRLWAEQHHSPQAAAEEFEKLLSAALAS